MKRWKKWALAALILLTACKKDSKDGSSSATGWIDGFWTYKEDPAEDYWNANVLFKSDGTFRMYQALSLNDTASGPALADTAGQVVTFGTYSVSGTTVTMKYSEFNIIDFTFTGSVNSTHNIIVGNLSDNNPGDAEPLWYLTKP
ncbi:MAG TPA: hypothetical protein VHE54_04680 [Puia sp.]|nr:hypothetical protein [Puia sp.]